MIRFVKLNAEFIHGWFSGFCGIVCCVDWASRKFCELTDTDSLAGASNIDNHRFESIIYWILWMPETDWFSSMPIQALETLLSSCQHNRWSWMHHYTAMIIFNVIAFLNFVTLQAIIFGATYIRWKKHVCDSVFETCTFLKLECLLYCHWRIVAIPWTTLKSGQKVNYFPLRVSV